MNDEEEGAMAVTQEPHPASVIEEEQSPPETNPATEQLESLEAENSKADEGEEGREVRASSSIAERSGDDVIVGDLVEEGGGEIGESAEEVKEAVSVGEDEILEQLDVVDEIAKLEGTEEDANGAGLQDCEMVETEGKVENESGFELKAETEVIEGGEEKEIKMEERLGEVEEEIVEAEGSGVKDEGIPENEDMIAVQNDDGPKLNESLPVGQEGGELQGGEKDVCNDSEEVREDSSFAGAAVEGNQVDAGIGSGEEEEVARVKESCLIGGDGKLDGDKEVRMDKKQDDELNVSGETGEADEKTGGDKEMEEAESLQDGAMGEDGKTQALGTEANVVKESDIELEEIEEIKAEERQSEASEDKEMEAEEEEKEMEVEEEKEMEAEAEEEEKEIEADEREEAPKSGSVKQKRGRNSKSAVKAPPRKVVGEDVCFICLDGGDLVLCDRRGCPKAYHPSCVDRDEAFFRSKGLWNCGWHLCRECKKNAYYMCYTCQCSLCKGCLENDATFFCVRGSKGLCQTCMKSVMLIENNEGNGGMATFDDKSSMDYLFKDYWIEQKKNLSLTSDEIAQLIKRWKRSNSGHSQGVLADAHEGNTEGGAVSDNSLATRSERKKSTKRMRSSTTEVDYDADADGSTGKAEATGTKKRGRRHLKSQPEEADPNVEIPSKDHLGVVPRRKKAKKLSHAHTMTDERTSSQSSTEWASKELLEFVAHVKNGDKSALSQFDVQELLLEYVKRNKLRDPRRTSQIVCDAMLQKLFGKPRVGHIEMLKLLESHFFVKEDSQGDDNQGSVLDAEVSQLGTDENTDSFMDVGKSRGRKARKKGGLQSNLDDYAAIDMHNINLIYLRRNLIEALMEDSERFHEKVVGSFVRIKIPGSSQKQDIYRLVQVIGTPKAPELYKVGKKIADCMLEILNLSKTEVIPIDIISNQDFDEDECKRLRQSIKCGLLSRLTVGDVLDKAKDLHEVRVTDWLETEITRLKNLCDRASDLGRKKQLRECVEKSQLLNTPEERQRRLDEVPEVHADPNMDPSYESEDESEPENERDSDIRPRETPFSRREREHFTSRKGGDSPSTDPWSSTPKSPSKKWELTRSSSGKSFSSRSGDAVFAEEALSGRSWSPDGDKMSSQSTTLEKLKTPPDLLTGSQSQLAETRTNISASAPSPTSRPPSSLVQNEVKISETEKLWHYKDPTAKIQGPFSVVQLRKWNKNGYFPSNLRIWRTAQSENDSILLTEALAGRYGKEPSLLVAKPVEAPSQQVHRGQVINTLMIDPNRGAGSTRNTTDQLSPNMQRFQADPRFSSADSSNRPTSSQSITPGSTGKVRLSRWSGSPTPVQLPSTPTGAVSLPGAIGKLPSPTPDSSQVTRSSSSPSYERNRSFDRSRLTHQSTREGERLGSVYTQNPSTQQTLQSVSHTAAVSNNNNSSQGSSNTAVQPATGQNPAASAHGWGSGGYASRPETMNSNLNNMNAAMQAQGQQQAYTHWPNTPANTLPPPPPPPYGAGQTTGSGTFPAQNRPAFPSQAQWTTQVPAVQPNMQQVGTAAPGSQGVAATQHPGNAGWAQQMQAYANMGWVAPSGPSPAGQFSSQPGTTAGAAMVQTSGPALGMQPGNMNPGWVASAANPSAPGPWNWQPPQGGSGMVAAGSQIPNGQRFCPFLMQGHCVKGATCDYRHN